MISQILGGGGVDTLVLNCPVIYDCSLLFSLSMISTKLLALEIMTPANSVESTTVKFSISSSTASSMMVTLTQEREWRDCSETNERTLGRPA